MSSKKDLNVKAVALIGMAVVAVLFVAGITTLLIVASIKKSSAVRLVTADGEEIVIDGKSIPATTHYLVAKSGLCLNLNIDTGALMARAVIPMVMEYSAGKATGTTTISCMYIESKVIKYLTSSADGKTVNFTDKRQDWIISTVSPNKITIKNVASGKYLTVDADKYVTCTATTAGDSETFTDTVVTTAELIASEATTW